MKIIDDIKKQFADKLEFIEHDNVLLPLNPSWKKIALSVSGGADSALLSYLLSYYIMDKNLDIEIHFISNVRMWETRPWQRYDSLRIYNWIEEHFPMIQYHRHENFIAPEIEAGTIGRIIPHFDGELKGGDQISTFSYANYICSRENIDAWFAAITKNPPQDFSGAPCDRESKFSDKLENIINFYKDTLIAHPFAYQTKEWVIKQYKDYDLLELLENTRSCEGDKNSAPEVFGNLDFYSYTPNSFVPVCKKCYWCKEREWALKQNNL